MERLEWDNDDKVVLRNVDDKILGDPYWRHYFDHLIKDKYGDKKVKGTYFTINELEERVVELEKLSHEPQNGL